MDTERGDENKEKGEEETRPHPYSPHDVNKLRNKSDGGAGLPVLELPSVGNHALIHRITFVFNRSRCRLWV